MLECLAFIFKLVLKFLYMLFDIDVGFTNLGTLMCVTFIFLPMVLTVVNFLRSVVIDELDDAYDSGKYSLFGDKSKKRYKGKHEYKPKHAKR